MTVTMTHIHITPDAGLTNLISTITTVSVRCHWCPRRDTPSHPLQQDITNSFTTHQLIIVQVCRLQWFSDVISDNMYKSCSKPTTGSLCVWATVSTQPSTLYGMVKCISAFRLSNIKWQWWVSMW